MDFYHDIENNSFKLDIKGVLSELVYNIEGSNIYITKTYVPNQLRGRGIAKDLVLKVVEYARERNLKIIPVCSYALTFFQKYHEKYLDVLSK